MKSVNYINFYKNRVTVILFPHFKFATDLLKTPSFFAA